MKYKTKNIFTDAELKQAIFRFIDVMWQVIEDKNTYLEEEREFLLHNLSHIKSYVDV